MDNENAASTALQTQGETNIASSAARVQAETQAAIMVAQRFKRSESVARQDLIAAVKASPRLAEKATYQYPRGKKKDPVTGEEVPNIIKGPSTYIAREAARVWGNVRYGTEVIRETERDRQIRSFAWDMQTNLQITAEATFKKLILRNKWVTNNGRREKVPDWVEPDERELRELNNKYASIGERNCLLKVIPSHLMDEVLEVAATVTKEDAAKHPEATRAKLADAFMLMGVSVAMLEDYLRHPLKDTTPNEVAELRAIFTSIREGNGSWEEYRSSVLPSEDEVPEMPQLRELAKTLGWNDAKLSNEIGRNKATIEKLIASMSEQIAKAKAATEKPVDKPAESSPQEQPAQTQPAKETAARKPAPSQGRLGEEREF
jgi:hypothetical protein